MAEDTGEGPRDPSKREFLKKLGKTAAVVVGAAAGIGGAAYLDSRASEANGDSVKITPLEDLLLGQGDASKWDPLTQKTVTTEGYLMRLSTKGAIGLSDVHYYGLFPEKPKDDALPKTMEEYRDGAKRGFLPVSYIDDTANRFIRGDASIKDFRDEPPADGFARVKGLFSAGYPDENTRLRRASLVIGPEAANIKPLPVPAK